MARKNRTVVINGLLLCYSSDWTLLAAAEALCREAHPRCDVICVSDVSELLALAARLKPQCVVLVLTARSHVGLLYNLRRHNRTVPLLILQDGVLLSDEAVADYTERAFVLDITGMRPDRLRKRLASVMVVAVASALPLRHFLFEAGDDPVAKNVIMSEIEHYIYRRLAAKIRSVRLCEDALLWFARGEQVQLIASGTSIDAGAVYQRRTTLCQHLGVRTRELPSALTVMWENHIRSDAAQGVVAC